MLALTNTTAAPGLDRYDPDRWDGRRLRDEAAAAAREAVTTFGHGPHRCPAQRFSLSAITRTVARLADDYELDARFTSVRPITEQIGGVARAADPCPIAYRARWSRSDHDRASCSAERNASAKIVSTGFTGPFVTCSDAVHAPRGCRGRARGPTGRSPTSPDRRPSGTCPPGAGRR